MNKKKKDDGELKRPNHKAREQEDSAPKVPVSPDTNAPMGYIKDRPLRDELDEGKVREKAKGEAPGNEVEASLNPDEENSDEETGLDKDKS